MVTSFNQLAMSKNSFTNRLVLLIAFQLFAFLTVSAQNNPAGIDSTFGIGVFNENVNASALLPDDKILVAGNFTNYKTTAVGKIARLSSEGTIDTAFKVGTGANATIYAFAVQPDGKIIIGGAFTSFNGTPINRIARLNSNGSLDISFNPGLGANERINSVALQADGKILITGSFFKYNGINIYYFARINSDGSFDASFAPPSPGGSNNKITIQPDGKILLVGDHTNYAGRKYIARFNTNGTLDAGFSTGSGFNGTASAYALQTDGKIILCGNFTAFNGNNNVHGIIRLNSNGTADNTFITGSGFDYGYNVFSIILQSDGKILLSGNMSIYNGTQLNTLARLNTDGTVDNSLIVGSGGGYPNYIWDVAIGIQSNGKLVSLKSINQYASYAICRYNYNGTIDNSFNASLGANVRIDCSVEQSDGKIIIGGGFTEYNGTIRNGIARLMPNGNLDSSFIPTSPDNIYIRAVQVQNDKKIIAGGRYIIANGTPPSPGLLIRYNEDGSIDNTFTVPTTFNGIIKSIAIHPDGKILIAGDFFLIDGSISFSDIGRLNNDGSLDNSFNTGVGLSGNQSLESVTLLSDGKILIAGNLNNYNNTPQKSIARLNPNGTIDNSFLSIGNPILGTINSVAVQADDKIVVAGYFGFLNSSFRTSIARLNPNGTIDPTFAPISGADSEILDIVLDREERILAVGRFLNYDGITSRYLARINQQGLLDTLFKPLASIYEGNQYLSNIMIQEDEKIIITGDFYSYQGFTSFYIARLNGQPSYFNTLRGKIVNDINKDCLYQFPETGLSDILVKTLPGPYYTSSNASGNYNIKVDSGTVTYTLQQQFNKTFAKLFTNNCAQTLSASMTGSKKDSCCFDFADSVKTCALLNVSIQNSTMRRCERNATYINYCNYGTATATSVQIHVEYPDYLEPISSTPMWSSKNGKVLTYNLTDLGSGQCDKITLIDSVHCNDESIRGLTQCIKATILPISSCISTAGWDQSNISASGKCLNDSVNFTLRNIGSADMTDSSIYRIYSNDTLIFINKFSLKTNQKLTIKYPSEGNTIRLEADQNIFYPGESRPRATVEACGATTNPTIISSKASSSPLDDLDEGTAVTCNIITNSHDPNAKHVTPTGIGSANQIAPGTELEYTIHFQNTGNSIANTVKLIDTLDLAIDPGSFIKGTSSHPYSFTISGKGKVVLTFFFPNIFLPDSTANKAQSNGLVSFRITVPSSTPLGTVINNKAYIYFDYNSPIISNETYQTVNITTDSDLSKGNKVQATYTTLHVTAYRAQNLTIAKVYPNPTAGLVTIDLPNSTNTKSEFRLYSSIGVLQKTIQLTTNTNQEISLENINTGIYLYEIWQEGMRKSGGILQIRQ